MKYREDQDEGANIDRRVSELFKMEKERTSNKKDALKRLQIENSSFKHEADMTKVKQREKILI